MAVWRPRHVAERASRYKKRLAATLRGGFTPACINDTEIPPPYVFTPCIDHITWASSSSHQSLYFSLLDRKTSISPSTRTYVAFCEHITHFVLGFLSFSSLTLIINGLCVCACTHGGSSGEKTSTIYIYVWIYRIFLHWPHLYTIITIPEFTYQ